ncbi:MAG: nucleotide exchange factor GrpE [Parvibaculales bacterium]
MTDTKNNQANKQTADQDKASDPAGDEKLVDILSDVTPPEDVIIDDENGDAENEKSLDDMSPEEQVVKLQETILKLNDALAEKDDEILRYAAELQNTRRRAEKDRADALKYGVTGFARDMVAVGDNLTRALNAIEESDREGLSDNVVNLLEGVAATERDLMAALQRNNIKPLNPMGEKFDANFHEAMYEAPGTGQAGGTIIEVVEIGFTIGERLLRAAKVGVAKD